MSVDRRFKLIDGTSPFTAITNPAGGAAGQFLLTNGTGGFSLSTTLPAAAFANPTGSVELTETNGVAVTAMRSDAAPKLDQGISPTMTGTWLFTGLVTHTPAGAGTALTINPNTASRGIQITANGQFGLAITGPTALPSIFLDNTAQGAGTAALRVDVSVTTGIRTATFTSTNKPGTTNQTTPSTWWPVQFNGVLMYIPVFSA